MCESVDIPHVDHVPRRPSALQVHRTLGFERAGVEGRGAEMREDSVVSGEREGLPEAAARRDTQSSRQQHPCSLESAWTPPWTPPNLEACPTSHLAAKPRPDMSEQ